MVLKFTLNLIPHIKIPFPVLGGDDLNRLSYNADLVFIDCDIQLEPNRHILLFCACVIILKHGTKG